MARRKVRNRGKMALRFANRERKVGNAAITVQPGAHGFRACVKLGKRQFLDGHRGPAYPYCATGKNPRKAIANALRFTARFIGKRRGAFAGLGNVEFPAPRRFKIKLARS